MAIAKKLPSGNWRVNQYIGKSEEGRRKYKSFTAPTKKEAEYLAANYVLHQKNKSIPENLSIGEAIDKYIAAKTNILSPTTISLYKKIRKNNFKDFQKIPIGKINAAIAQEAVNNEAKKLSPKSISNAWGLISAAIKYVAPDCFLKVSLPPKKKKFKELPSPKDIIRIVQGTEIELPTLFALWLGLRMSEIRGIQYKDIKNNILTIRRTVLTVDGQHVVRDQNKTYDSARKLQLPPYLLSLIEAPNNQNDFIIKLSGQAIYNRFVHLIEKNGLPHMTFHDLRHLNASIMLQLGIPDKYAMERGGWATNSILKSVYQHTFSDQRKVVDKAIDQFFEGVMQHEMQHENIK